jgi:hypothetical protein
LGKVDFSLVYRYQDGYLQVLVVNESNVPVWFDDLAITQTESLIVQENHYDPWA